MKILGLLGSIIISVVLSSALAYHEDQAGREAADFKIENGRESFRLADAKGHEVTLHFWSASDPESRMANARLSREARADGRLYISICTDEDKALAQAILRADGVDLAGQFMASDVKQGDPVLRYAPSGPATLRLKV